MSCGYTPVLFGVLVFDYNFTLQILRFSLPSVKGADLREPSSSPSPDTAGDVVYIITNPLDSSASGVPSASSAAAAAPATHSDKCDINLVNYLNSHSVVTAGVPDMCSVP